MTSRRFTVIGSTESGKACRLGSARTARLLWHPQLQRPPEKDAHSTHKGDASWRLVLLWDNQSPKSPTNEPTAGQSMETGRQIRFSRPPRAFGVTVLRHRPGSGRSQITPSASLGSWKETLTCASDREVKQTATGGQWAARSRLAHGVGPFRRRASRLRLRPRDKVFRTFWCMPDWVGWILARRRKSLWWAARLSIHDDLESLEKLSVHSQESGCHS